VSNLPPGARPPPLVQGDATCLPFAAGAFDAVLTVHVFHLLANWRAALAAARRVLRPGGIFLSGYDWRPPDSPGARLLVRWREILGNGGQAEPAAGVQDFADIQAALLATGARMDEHVVGEWTVTRSLARQLETIEHRTWAAGPAVSADRYADGLAELRAWAEATYGGLDRGYAVVHRFVWQRFTWPDPAREM
jgi:SAM-dependent methyltransferase